MFWCWWISPVPSISIRLSLPRLFTKPVIGVITKVDLAPENEESCLRQLRLIGVGEPIFRVSVPTGVGIAELKEYLFGPAKK